MLIYLVPISYHYAFRAVILQLFLCVTLVDQYSLLLPHSSVHSFIVLIQGIHLINQVYILVMCRLVSTRAVQCDDRLYHE